MSYDYPPSEHIRKYEPFEPDSHYYVRGNCLSEGKEYPCDFEVAYTLNGQIYVVCYIGLEHRNALFGHPTGDEIFGQELYIEKEESIQVDFAGVELRNGHKIFIRSAVSIDNGVRFLAGYEAPIFIANSYILKVTHETVLWNNPPQDTTFEIINILGNSTFSGAAPFNIGKSKILTLNVSSQQNTNSTLTVPRNCIPIGWRAEDVAELWCSSISIATGLDIRWIVKNVRNKRAITQTFIYRRNIMRNLSTYGILPNHSPFWLGNALHEFIKVVFSHVWDRSLSIEAIRDYSRLMWQFVEYRLITNRAEDQARLISTTVEELLKRWEDHTKNVAKGTVSAAEANILWDQLDTTLLKNLKTLLPTSKSDQRGDIKRRFRKFLSSDMVKGTFEQRLRNLFKHTKNDDEWFKHHVEARLENFVNTRNEIAHEGHFPSQDSLELFEYYYEMLMILPLMIFSIFGYTGDYLDLAGEYRRINAKRLSQPKTEQDHSED